MASVFSDKAIRAIVDACLRLEEWARPESRTEWDELIRAAGFHQVRPLVWERIESEDMPRAARKRLGTCVRYNREIVRLLLEREEALRHELEAAGVGHRFLKGPSMAVRYYGSPDRREIGDIDLLIAPDSTERVDALLEKLGYGAWMIEAVAFGRSKELLYRSHEIEPTPIWIDLHQRLFSVSPDDSLTATLLAGDSEPEATVAHLAGHAAAHRIGKLKHLVDLQRVLVAHPEIDWALLRELVTGSVLAPGIDLAIRRAEEIAPGTAAPWTAMDSLMPAGSARLLERLVGPSAWSHLASGAGLRGPKGILVGTLMVRGSRPRWRQLRRAVVLDPVELRQSHGREPDEPLARIRVRRLAAKFTGLLSRGVR